MDLNMLLFMTPEQKTGRMRQEQQITEGLADSEPKILEDANTKENSEHEPNNRSSEKIKLLPLVNKEQTEEPKMMPSSTANGSHDDRTKNDGTNRSLEREGSPEMNNDGLSQNHLNCSNTHIRYGTAVVILSLIIIAALIYICILRAGMSQKSPVCPSCPENWITWKNKCYYFSDTEETWNSSQNNCTSHGASLFVPYVAEETTFVRRFMDRTEYWIGLKRLGERQPWKWSNGSVFNNLFEIRANGLCAYLDNEKNRSTRCNTKRNWICIKSLPAL